MELSVNKHSNREQIGHSSHDSAIMNSLKAKLEGILDSFDTTKRVVFFDYPLLLNVGDLLINLGTECFLSDHNIHIWKRFSADDMPESIRGMDDDVIIICQGGGNFGDLWSRHHPGRESLLAYFPRNRIILLPQSVHFDSPDRLQKSMERFRSHGNCHIFARDNRSLDILQHAGVHQSSAMPDMAQYLWGILLPDTHPVYESQPMRFVRRDKEAKTYAALEGEGNALHTVDWREILTLSTHRIARLILKAIDLQNRMGFHAQKYWQWRFVQDKAIRDGVRYLSRFRKIYTNRLHGMILGLLLSREVCAFDNSYGKLSSYRESWLSGMDDLNWEPEK